MVVAIYFFSNVHICNDLFVYSVWSTFLTTFLRTFLSALRQEYFFEHFIDHFSKTPSPKEQPCTIQ